VIIRRRIFLGAAASLLAGCDGSRVLSWERGALAMAVTDEHLYWTSGVDHSGLIRVPRGGGDVQVLYDGMPWAVSLSPGPRAMFVGSGRGVERAPYVGLRGKLVVPEAGGAFRVVVDGDRLFWLVRRSGTVRSADLRGQGATTLAAEAAWGSDLAVAGDQVFWTAGEPGSLYRVSRHGGEVEALLEGVPGLGPLAVSGEHLYAGHARGLSRVALSSAGGAASRAEPIVEGRASPSALRPLGDGVCWSEEGRIRRWSPTRGEQGVEAGRVLAMATAGETLWWVDGDGKALRRHAF